MTSTAMNTTAPKPSRLGDVISGRIISPLRYCFYGPESVGKTTLAAHSPDPIFIDIEKGANNLNANRYRFESGVAPGSYAEFLEAITDLTVNDHSYKTLVIDSVDRLETLIWDYIVEAHSGKSSSLNQKAQKFDSIDGFPWSKGYGIAVSELSKLLGMLETLREERKMAIIFVGHSCIVTVKNPIGEDYDKYALRLHTGNKTGGNFQGKVKEWCDVIGFCNFEEGGGSLAGERSRGFYTGRRLLHLKKGAAFDAKSRVPVPDEIELNINDPWHPLGEAIKVGQEMAPKEILSLIGAELSRIGDEQLRVATRANCKNAEDAAELGRILSGLKNKQPEEEIEENV